MRTISTALALLTLLLCTTPLRAVAAEELTLLATVTRVVNLPMLVGLRLLEREDGITVRVKDLRSPESVMLAVIEGLGAGACQRHCDLGGPRQRDRLRDPAAGRRR